MVSCPFVSTTCKCGASASTASSTWMTTGAMSTLRPCQSIIAGDGFITCDMALAAMLAKATRMAMPPMVIFWWANAFKYLWRWAYKSDCTGDLNKAIDCIERVRDWQKTR